MDFIETRSFLRKVRKVWNMAAYAELQDDLAENPDAGAILRGGQGIRKIRRRMEGTGKSGGVRVIYFWQVQRDIIIMLDIYGKGEKDSLSDRELKELVSLKNEVLKTL